MIDIARARRVHLHGIPIDEDGMRMDMLENYLLERQPRLIFVMPSFQNPSGRVMSLHRRRQLLNLASEFNIPVLEDGVYHELRFEGESLPPLKALDEHGMVIHTSGFTKNLLPGMRIGYLISDHAHYERLARVKQAADIATPGLNQRAMHYLIERGLLSQQLERNNRELRRRRDVALDACARHLPTGSRWNVPEGGLYLWIELPRNGPTSAELYISAIQHGVAYAIGSVFYPAGGGSYRLRWNYGAHRPAEIEEGLCRLGRAWRDLGADYADLDKAPIL
jgi:DNA-binding transcriptional MocR family regulator